MTIFAPASSDTSATAVLSAPTMEVGADLSPMEAP